MKRFLLICFIPITAGCLGAQTPPNNGTEAMENGQHYIASQTARCAESATRLGVAAIIN
jgi:hypothetical protein